MPPEPLTHGLQQAPPAQTQPNICCYSAEALLPMRCKGTTNTAMQSAALVRAFQVTLAASDKAICLARYKLASLTATQLQRLSASPCSPSRLQGGLCWLQKLGQGTGHTHTHTHTTPPPLVGWIARQARSIQVDSSHSWHKQGQPENPRVQENKAVGRKRQ